MDIQKKLTLAEKQAFWAEQLPNFEAKYWLSDRSEFLVFDMNQGNYVVKDDLDPIYEDDANDTFHRVNTGWAMWKKAINFSKQQVVPEGFVLVEASELESLKSDNMHFTESCIDWTDRAYKQREKVEFIKGEVERFKQSGTDLDLERFLDNLIEFSTFKHDAEFDGFVLVDKSHTEDWYLDPHEHMWFEQDGIDNWLSELDIGDVEVIEHKEYLITKNTPVFATKVWDDSSNNVGCWEFFNNKEEAEKAAAYCKAKFNDDPNDALSGWDEAQEQEND